MKTSTAKMSVNTAPKIIPAAKPNGICNVPRATLFHLDIRSKLEVQRTMETNPAVHQSQDPPFPLQ